MKLNSEFLSRVQKHALAAFQGNERWRIKLGENNHARNYIISAVTPFGESYF